MPVQRWVSNAGLTADEQEIRWMHRKDIPELGISGSAAVRGTACVDPEGESIWPASRIHFLRQRFTAPP